MSFTPNIPTASQSLGQTQQLVQDNFTIINSTISQNHNAMNVANPGLHKFLNMPDQATPPATTTPTTQIALYCTANSNDSQEVLAFRRENKTGAFDLINKDYLINPVPLTSMASITGAGVPTIETDMKYNIASVSFGAGEFTITFATALLSTRYLVLVTAVNAGAAYPTITSRAVGSFKVKFSNGTATQTPSGFGYAVYGGHKA